MRFLLDEMFSPAIAVGLRARGVAVVALPESPDGRGLPDEHVFVRAQLEQRCLITENIADFVLIEAAWWAGQTVPHWGLVLVAPGTFVRHRRGAVGQLVRAIQALARSSHLAPGAVVWLRPE